MFFIVNWQKKTVYLRQVFWERPLHSTGSGSSWHTLNYLFGATFFPFTVLYTKHGTLRFYVCIHTTNYLKSCTYLTVIHFTWRCTKIWPVAFQKRQSKLPNHYFKISVVTADGKGSNLLIAARGKVHWLLGCRYLLLFSSDHFLDTEDWVEMSFISSCGSWN